MNIEIELITACINKEQRAEYELYQRSYAYLMSICLRYTNSREEAREVFNIGFFRILSNLHKYELNTSFNAWMHKVMVNAAIDEYRKEKRHHKQIAYVENYDDVEENTEVNSALSRMDIEEINALIKELPPVSQKVFNLFVIDGYSHKEIAGMMQMSEGTSRWHVNFSKTKLKELILQITKPLKMSL